MFDQKSDEPFVRAERRAMNADRRLLGVVLVFVNEIEPARLREIDLVRSEEHTSELQSHLNLVCRLLLEKKKDTISPLDSNQRIIERPRTPHKMYANPR